MAGLRHSRRHIRLRRGCSREMKPWARRRAIRQERTAGSRATTRCVALARPGLASRLSARSNFLLSSIGGKDDAAGRALQIGVRLSTAYSQLAGRCDAPQRFAKRRSGSVASDSSFAAEALGESPTRLQRPYAPIPANGRFTERLCANG
jgi:hypothetical protein